MPASVRIKRESVVKSKSQTGSVRKPDLAPGESQPAKKPEQKKPVSAMDEKLADFLSEVQELGAFDD